MDKTPDTAAPAPAADINAGKDGAPAPKQKREFVTKGEKLHSLVSYLSIDVVWNAISGVSFAYLGKYTNVGQKIWQEPVTWLSTKAIEPFFKMAHKDKFLEKAVQDSLKESVEKSTMFASIIAGGMLFTVPPLMVLENKKVKKSITQFFDKHIYGKDTCTNDPKFQKAYDEIGNEPKKGFLVGNLARYMALAPLLASVLIEKSRDFTMEHYYNPLGGKMEKLAYKAGITPQKLFKNLSEAEALERWAFIRKNAAMDVGMEIPYAAMHFALYNLFAGMAANHRAKKEAKEHGVEAIAPAAHTIAHDIEKDEQAAARIAAKPASFSAREMPSASFAERSQASTPESSLAR